MWSLNFNMFTLYAAIFLAFSLRGINFPSVASAFTPIRNIATLTATPAMVSTNVLRNASNTDYESVGRRPTTATQESSDSNEDETSQEDEEDDTASDDNEDSNDYEEDRNCTCSGSNCVCCINLNLSFIDLGGPGCVKFGYVADNDSLAVDMLYGGRLLESDTLKRTSTEPTCMDLFSDLAQMCATFSGLTKVSGGVKGCVSVEPLLLGVSQTSYDVGCFNMDVDGVQPQLQTTTAVPTYTNGTKETVEKPDENEEEELAAAISQSAAEGINLFNNFIASVFGEEVNDTSGASEPVEPHNNRTNEKLTR